uniref:Uncharacterized protein n=1 Tax=Arundo donax TaxID=35708 RepID=A0A0A9FV66_ARUDO
MHNVYLYCFNSILYEQKYLFVTLHCINNAIIRHYHRLVEDENKGQKPVWQHCVTAETVHTQAIS